ncbi:phosphoenolpyruvate carboxykinase (ATP) [bacterium]|nr:phosphoenolpyruvate carboxykinase (ATP) [bacterium]
MTQALTHWLDELGIHSQSTVIYNPTRDQLVAEALAHHEGSLTSTGALNVITEPYTGRSPKDKYLVADPGDKTIWWGDVNRPIALNNFNHLQSHIATYLSERPIVVVDCFIGADPYYQQKVRVVAEFAWQALVVENLFIAAGTPHQSEPDITILAAPSFQTDPQRDHVRSNAAICLDLAQKRILVAGSKYAGEIKKAAFTVMNADLPKSGVLPMHCSANVGREGDVALFFGLSGTGKTTLSTTPDRFLIGDDEHGWGENGVFNLEGGCYAKTIRLNPDLESLIWAAANQPGTVLENVVLDPVSRAPNFDDATITENTRAAYPLSMIPNRVPSGTAGHPENIFFLTADAFGVMPPIALLNPDEIAYYFLSGYTSKIAGTERGLGGRPLATFSACFGEPFLPLLPEIYAKLLRIKVMRHNCTVWLVNTGWTAGDFNTGHRMPLPYTRQMVSWALSHAGSAISTHQDSVFGLAVPDTIPDIPTEILYPERTWSDRVAFTEVAAALKTAFRDNMHRFEITQPAQA